MLFSSLCSMPSEKMAIFLTVLTGKHLVIFCMLVFSLGPATEISTCLIVSTKIACYFTVHWTISLEHEALHLMNKITDPVLGNGRQNPTELRGKQE